MIEQLGMIKAPVNSAITKPIQGATDLTKQFGSYLNEAFNVMANEQKAAETMNEQFLKGEPVDIHQLMIAAEKVNLGLELTVQVRNKMIESYQEIMRMQM